MVFFLSIKTIHVISFNTQMNGLVYMQIANTQNQPENQPGPEVINTFFMLNSTEHEIFLLINVKMRWHFNIYEGENSIIDLSEPKKSHIS